MLEAENMQVTVPISPLFLYYFICHSIRKDSYHSKDNNNNNMNKRFLDGVCLDIEFKNVYKKKCIFALFLFSNYTHVCISKGNVCTEVHNDIVAIELQRCI